MLDAIVVGSGPNGLAAAVELARRGRSAAVIEGAATIGGGARTAELIEPGHWHDVCSAVHPFGIASPFLNQLPLERYGLEWLVPEVQVSHPTDGGAVGLLPSLDGTAQLLAADGDLYHNLVGPIVDRLDATVAATLRPLQAVWRRPIIMGRFGLTAIRSVESLAERFTMESTKGLLAGLGAHSIARLDSPATGGVALALAATAHGGGWPVARGGSQAIVDAMAQYLRDLGGTIETGRWIETLDDLTAKSFYLDTSPAAAARIGGRRISSRLAGQLGSWRYGPGSFKVDWILNQPIPWADDLSPRSATVHVGGTLYEIATSERRAVAGEPPEAPFVLVTQPSLVDDSRAPAGRHVAWGYCHVPNGYEGDATAAIESQVERFAPGFADTIVARHVQTTAALEQYNPNYVGGDIGGGSFDLRQLLIRPRPARNPYQIGDGVFLCSASTPPGAGVHGMCGYNAVSYST